MQTTKMIILAAHNLFRWAIVLLAIFAVYRLALSWIKKDNWQKQDQKALTFLMIGVDIQLLLGVLLYFVFSDLTKAAFENFGSAMGNPILRFYAVEHFLMMAVGIILIHVAQSAGKKEFPDQQKRVRVTMMLGLAVVLILAGIPWTTRPLLPII